MFNRYPVAMTVALLIFARAPLTAAIAASWGIALLEYCFQVPANRIGYGALTLTQLKIVQEIITLLVFAVFAYFVFGQGLKWNYAVSYLFILGAVYFAFKA